MIFEDYWNISDSTAIAFKRVNDIVQERYPKFPSATMDFTQPAANEFAEWYWSNASIDDILLLQSDELSEETVTRYIELLRSQKEIDILPIQGFKDPRAGWDNGRNSFVPFKIEGSWAFAKTYENYIHWFDGIERPTGEDFMPFSGKKVAKNWTGPKCQVLSNSGIYMLIGIRRLAEGLPHLSEISSTDAHSFRCHMLTELLSDKLNPEIEDIEALRQRFNAFHSSHFDDAIQGIGPVEGTSESRPSPHESSPPLNALHGGGGSIQRMHGGGGSIQCMPEPIPSPHESSPPLNAFHSARVNNAYDGGGGSIQRIPETIPIPLESGQTPLESGQTPLEFGQTPLESGQTPLEFGQTRLEFSQGPLELRYAIAHNLNNAVMFCRSTRVTEATSLDILWSLVSEKITSSDFHYRYFQVLFYTRVSQLDDATIQRQLAYNKFRPRVLESIHQKIDECKRLVDFCDKRADWGAGKYALLCAIPPDCNEYTFGLLEERVMDPEDVLVYQLAQAWPLVNYILTCIHSGQFPSERLMIENYRKTEKLTDQYYEALTSIDPRVKMRIPQR